jgi:hypothetical protein
MQELFIAREGKMQLHWTYKRQLQKRAGHRGQENDKIGAHAGWKMREKSYAQVD